MRRFLLTVIACIPVTACGDRSVQSGDLLIASHPDSFPGDLPQALLYPESKVDLLGQLDVQGFWSPAQYALSFRTAHDAMQVRSYYLDFLRRDHWQILQSRHFDAEKKTVVVAESPMKRIVTLIIPDGSPTVVQLYLKRSSDD